MYLSNKTAAFNLMRKAITLFIPDDGAKNYFLLFLDEGAAQIGTIIII